MSDIDVVNQVYGAMATQDLERVLQLVAADCVITQDPSLPWGGRHIGHDGITNFALALIGTIDSAVTSDALFEADGKVIQIGRTKGVVRANGATFDVPEVHTWTIREGKVIAAHFAIDTPATLHAISEPG